MQNEKYFGKNNEIADSLKNYLKSQSSEFAVLLKGEWGSGKTYFIKKFIDKLRQEENSPYTFCYISLFGISTLEEIDKQILASISPLLNSEKVQKMGRLAGQSLDFAGKFIPYLGLVKEGASALCGIKDIFTNIPDNLVIILDDFERVNIPTDDVLGWCHDLLTVNKAKIILLADESKIVSNKSHKNQNLPYTEIKEKVIGKTLIVQSDLSSVIDDVIIKISDYDIKSTINKSEIEKNYSIGCFRNLRVLQYYIYELESLLKYCKDKGLLKNNILICGVSNALFSITFMKSVHGIDAKTYFGVSRDFSIPKSEESYSDKEKQVLEYNQRYGILPDIWKVHFEDDFDYAKIIEEYLRIYDASSRENETNFPILNLNDAELREKLEIIDRGILEKKYTVAKEILSLVNLKIFLQNVGYIDEKKEDIVKKIMDYILSITVEKDTLLLQNQFKYEFEEMASMTYRNDYEEMKPFVELIKENLDDTYKKETQSMQEFFLNNLNNYDKIYEFFEHTDIHLSGFTVYNLDVDVFFNKIVPCSDKKKIFYYVTKHLKSCEHVEEKCPTCIWWKSFCELVKNDKRIKDFNIISLKLLCQHANLGEHNNVFKDCSFEVSE